MTIPLREGFTTGSAASAAAKAGALFLLAGHTAREVSVPLPPGGRLAVPVADFEREKDAVRVTVIKDGGDDPDATHGKAIQVVVELHPGADRPPHVLVRGGRGVGRVTLPGLPVPVGRAAINPAPRAQIAEAVREALDVHDFRGAAEVLIEVPEGEEIAKKTLNPRLGIVGGISILGTSGIVKPYSHASYEASISQALDVARAAGLRSCVLTTGRRSERFHQARHPELPELAFVQVADYFAHAMREAVAKGFTRITWAVFFGKLVKQAQGEPYTHAREYPVDFGALAARCRALGAPEPLVADVRAANTAMQVLAMLEGIALRRSVVADCTASAVASALRFAGAALPARAATLPAVGYAVYDFDGAPLL